MFFPLLLKYHIDYLKELRKGDTTLRDINTLNINDLLSNKPTLEEVNLYFIKWYKARKKQYGDAWTNTFLINELSTDYLKEFFKLFNEKELKPNFLPFIEEAAAELQQTIPAFNAFRNASYIYTLAKKKQVGDSILNRNFNLVGVE